MAGNILIINHNHLIPCSRKPILHSNKHLTTTSNSPGSNFLTIQTHKTHKFSCRIAYKHKQILHLTFYRTHQHIIQLTQQAAIRQLISAAIFNRHQIIPKHTTLIKQLIQSTNSQNRFYSSQITSASPTTTPTSSINN